jgi:hypothetical protein
VSQFSYNSRKIEFYDESQARDNSGKWTGGGGGGSEASAQAKASEQEAYSQIQDTSIKSQERAKELGENYEKDEQEDKEWAKILANNTESKEESDKICQTISLYTSGGERNTTEITTEDGNTEVVYEGAESIPAIQGEGLSETVNNILRGNLQPVGEKKEFDKVVDKVDKFIKIAPKNESSQLYRGMFTRSMEHDDDGKITSSSDSDESAFAFAKNVKAGDIVSDNGFMSASQSEKAARKFSGDTSLDGRAFFDPNKDSGAKVFMTIKNTKGYGSKIPKWSTPWEEKEVLMPRGTKLKILSVDRKEVKPKDSPDSYEKNLDVNITAEVLR